MAEETLPAVLLRLFRGRTFDRVRPGAKICEIWGEVFRQPQGTREFLLLLDGVRWIIGEVLRQVDTLQLPEDAAERYRNSLMQLQIFTDLEMFGSEWRSVAATHLNDRHIDALVFLDAHLEPRSLHQRINGALLDDFRKDVDDLLHDLPMLDLSDEVKRIMRVHLRSIVFILDNLS